MMMKTTRSARARSTRFGVIGAALAAMAMLLAACVEDPPPAPPAPVQIDFADSAIAGGVRIDVEVPEDDSDPENPVPGYTLPVEVDINGTATGSWLVSGDFEADLDIADGTFELEVPDVATLSIAYAAEASPATGFFDRATGAGGLSTDLTMTVQEIDLLGEIEPPCDVVFQLDLTGSIDAGTGVLTVTQSSFDVQTPDEEDCSGLGGIMGQLLGVPTNSASLSFAVVTD
jgi:hypothetical protein